MSYRGLSSAPVRGALSLLDHYRGRRAGTVGALSLRQATLADAPSLLWTLDGTLQDASVFGRHATVTAGAAAYSAAGAPIGSAQALSLDGATLLSAPADLPLVHSTWALEVWVLPTLATKPAVSGGQYGATNGTPGGLIDVGQGTGAANAAGLGVAVAKDGLTYYLHGSGYAPIIGAVDADLSAMSHVVINVAAGVITTWVNGVNLGTLNAQAISGRNIYRYCDIGRSPWGNYTGACAYVAAYPAPLAAARIAAHYAAGHGG